MQSSPLFSALGLMMLPVVFMATSPASAVVGGEPQLAIVVADNATPAEKYAATELASFLKQITGLGFEVKPSAANDEPRLLEFRRVLFRSLART